MTDRTSIEDGVPGAASRPADRVVVTARVGRMAAWPVSTIEPFGSPSLAASARDLLQARAAAAEQSAGVADAIASAVPGLHDAASRRLALAVRRALHRGLGPVPAAVELARSVPALAAELTQVGTTRDELAGLEASFARAYAEQEGAERAWLGSVVGDVAFQRALALANPVMWRQWHATGGAGDPATPSPPVRPSKARHRRLELALVNLALRAAGRPTPAGAWAGVFAIDVEAGDAGDDPSSDPPVLRFGDATRALDVQVDLDPFVDVLLASTGRGVPSGAECAWDALDRAGQELPHHVQAPWATAVAAIRELCLELGATFDDVAPARIAEVEGQVRSEIDQLRRGVGLAPWVAPSVLRADLRLGVRATMGVAGQRRLEDAVAAWEQAHERIGVGPLWGEATASALLAHEPAPVAADGPAPPVPTVVSLFRHAFGDPWAGRAAALAHAFERRIARHRVGGDPAVDLLGDHQPSSAGDAEVHGTSPWGSALVDLTPSRLGPSVSVRAVRGEPGIFIARFARLVPEAFAGTLAGMAAAGSVPCEVRPTRFANPSAALAPSLASRAADPACPLRVLPGHRVALAQRDAGAEGVAVPVLVTAAGPLPISTEEARLVRAASTWGWELVSAGLPPLPREVDEWRHLPELVAGPTVTIQPERWLLASDDVRACAAVRSPSERYLRWRGLCDRLGLPDRAVVRFAASPNATNRTLPTTGALAVEAFLSGLPDDLAVVLVHPDRRAAPAEGWHGHVTEVALSWVRRQNDR